MRRVVLRLVLGAWLSGVVACGTASGSVRPDGRRELPSDPARMVPRELAVLIRARVADLHSHPVTAAFVDEFQQTLHVMGESSELMAFLASHGETFVLGIGARDLSHVEAVFFATGDFRGFQKLDLPDYEKLPDGGWAMVTGTGTRVRLGFWDDRHFAMVPEELASAVTRTLDDPETAFMERPEVVELREDTRFDDASVAMMVMSSPHYLQMIKQSEKGARGFPIFEQLVGGAVTLDIGPTFDVQGVLRTRGDTMARFLLQVSQNMEDAARQSGAQSPWVLLVDKAKLETQGADVVMRWNGSAEDAKLILAAFDSADDKPDEPLAPQDEVGALQASIQELRKQVQAQPLDAQAKADLGWALVRTGATDEGIGLVSQYPLPPTSRGSTLFPGAADLAARRQLIIGTLDKLSQPVDGTHMVLAHIFLDHLVQHDHVVDHDLTEQLRGIIAKTDALVYLDGLSASLYEEKDHAAQAEVLEKLITELERRQIGFPSNDHLSHYYYNAACALTAVGDYDRARLRLATGIKLNQLLYKWSLQDKDLRPLRQFMGEGAFKSVFEPKS